MRPTIASGIVGTRQSAIGQFLFFLSLLTVQEVLPTLKGAVSRNSAKLGNYKMPVKLRET